MTAVGNIFYSDKEFADAGTELVSSGDETVVVVS